VTPLASILAATDFSAHARNAALRAGMLARQSGARRMVLLHVMPELPLGARLVAGTTAAIEQALATHASELAHESGAAFEARLEQGAVADAIARAAEAFDLIAVGAKGTHPLRDLAIGTSAERLLRKSRCPVLVVKAAPRAAYRRVLVPVDFSDDSRAALAFTRRLAPEAELHLLHAFEALFESTLRLGGAPEEDIQRHRREARERAGKDMSAMLAGLKIDETRVSRIIAHGYPPSVISDSRKEIGADLIAIGKHGRSRLEELLLGSVTLHALAAAECDVLVVPGAG
jgi:nucleotide-binding universal stress UspA family protein